MAFFNWLAALLNGASAVHWGVEVTPGRCLSLSCDRTDPARPRVTSAQPLTEPAAQAQRFAGSSTTVLLPVDEYAIEWIDAPSVPDTELAGALRWTIQDRIDWPVADVAISAYRLAGNGTTRSTALVAAAPRDRIKHWVGAWPDKVHRYLAIDVPEQALRNLTLLTSGKACAGWLHAGKDSALLVVVREGAVETRRRLPYGQQALNDTSSHSFETFVLEIQRTLDAHGRSAGDATFDRLWVSSIGDAQALAQILGDQLSARCEAFDVARWIDWQAPAPLHDAASGCDYTYALGAALR